MIVEELYIKPKSIEEALKSAKQNVQNFKFIAGGTDVVVNQYQDNDNSSTLIDISGINELNEVAIANGYLKIGS